MVNISFFLFIYIFLTKGNIDDDDHHHLFVCFIFIICRFDFGDCCIVRNVYGLFVAKSEWFRTRYYNLNKDACAERNEPTK